MLKKANRFLIDHGTLAVIILLAVLWGGLTTLPFQHPFGFLPQLSTNVDAIPDIGENQQIVFTEWNGQSPQDIEDQITYPLTSYLLGISKVKSVRSTSMFGYSSIYIIFEDDAEYYWSRNRILEKINSLPAQLLPNGVRPKLGPDATALGQVFWYTLEGRDSEGMVTGGWSLQELRTLQDFYIKYALAGAQGVAEVASIGGYVKEYQVDVDPQLLKRYQVTLPQVFEALKQSNKEVGAQTLEINRAEYFVRGLGYVKTIEDLENTMVVSNQFKPIRIKDIGTVQLGPAERRGILDKGGAEVVGGVVTARYGEHMTRVVDEVKEKIKDLSPNLPTKTLNDGTVSQLTIVPFYDRTDLVKENKKTLGDALFFELLFVALVMIVMLRSLKLSLVVSGLMPIVVLLVFMVMAICSVDANIVALSGIAIAIGSVVDMGIILGENSYRKLSSQGYSGDLKKLIFSSAKEVHGAIITASLTTIISFLPVFLLSGAEGKMFFPLAFTKSVALFMAMMVTILLMPSVLYLVFRKRRNFAYKQLFLATLLLFTGVAVTVFINPLGLILVVYGLMELLLYFRFLTTPNAEKINRYLTIGILVVVLSIYWRPLGYTQPLLFNMLVVGFVGLSILVPVSYLIKNYRSLLFWILENKKVGISIPIILVLLGFASMLSMEKEFMPTLNEGDFLLMPISMPHSGITEVTETLKKLDMAVASIPEVDYVVGKAGRVDSPLDPAPLSMYENLIAYKPEFIINDEGKPIRFKTNGKGAFVTRTNDTVLPGSKISSSDLMVDKNGEYYRNWRNEIKSANDIWNEISRRTQLLGVTNSPKLQPIETRLIMLQTGMRSNLGIKVKGPDLKTIEEFSIKLESILQSIKGIRPQSVYAERITGKPYIVFDINRKAITRYGLSIETVQNVVQMAVGGVMVSETIEQRERFAIRLRYPRELRNSPENLENILVPLSNGNQIPIAELATIRFETGPQRIHSEDGFLVNQVIFDKSEERSEVEAVQLVKNAIEKALSNQELEVPKGVIYEFSGTFENYQHAQKSLSLILPLVLMTILLLLYLQFKSIPTAIIVLTGVLVAFSGGFILLWLYGQDWFLNVGDLRHYLNINRVNLSIAVWVGFIALFGIATDDGVVMATYLDQRFKNQLPASIEEIRSKVVEAGEQRIVPCLMTTATTMLALVPVLWSSGRGSEIMIPMAIPCMGGMFISVITLFVVPLLYCWKKELTLKRSIHQDE